MFLQWEGFIIDIRSTSEGDGRVRRCSFIKLADNLRSSFATRGWRDLHILFGSSPAVLARTWLSDGLFKMWSWSVEWCSWVSDFFAMGLFRFGSFDLLRGGMGGLFTGNGAGFVLFFLEFLLFAMTSSKGKCRVKIFFQFFF